MSLNALKGPKIDPGTPPPPPPLPKENTEAQDEAIAEEKKKSGYEKTIVAGNLTPNTGKRLTLG